MKNIKHKIKSKILSFSSVHFSEFLFRLSGSTGRGINFLNVSYNCIMRALAIQCAFLNSFGEMEVIRHACVWAKTRVLCLRPLLTCQIWMNNNVYWSFIVYFLKIKSINAPELFNERNKIFLLIISVLLSTGLAWACMAAIVYTAICIGHNPKHLDNVIVKFVVLSVRG